MTLARSVRSSVLVGLVTAALALPLPAGATDAGVWAELGRVQTLEAEFVQVQRRAILKVPLESRGSVRFTRPDRLTWVVEAPVASTFTLEHAVATMDYPELGTHERFDLASVPDANRLATSLMVWLQADASAVERDFTVTYGDGSAVLVPRDARLAGLIARIELAFAANPTRVRTVGLVEPDGDRVDIAFTDVHLDGVRAQP